MVRPNGPFGDMDMVFHGTSSTTRGSSLNFGLAVAFGFPLHQPEKGPPKRLLDINPMKVMFAKGSPIQVHTHVAAVRFEDMVKQ